MSLTRFHYDSCGRAYGRNLAERVFVIASVGWFRSAMPSAIRKHFGVFVTVLLLLCGCLACSTAEATGIDRSEYVVVADAKLYVLIRGANATAPVVLWLHGGPGGAERPLFRYFNGELEKHFVVAYWDQRGAGRSFDPDADEKRLTIAQHVADLDAIVDHLRRSLSAERVTLVGHSWGGALGLLYAQRYPDKVSALVAVNPLVSSRAAERAEFTFVTDEAMRRNDQDAMQQTRTVGEPPLRRWRDKLTIEKIVQRYGGVYHRSPPRLRIMLRAVFTGLVSPWEIRRIIQGNNASLAAMHEELRDLDIASAVPVLHVPVVFFLGRYDRHVDATIGAAYLERLCAPIKRMAWFEQSAHNVPFEEPALFNATLVRELAAINEHELAPIGDRRCAG